MPPEGKERSPEGGRPGPPRALVLLVLTVEEASYGNILTALVSLLDFPQTVSGRRCAGCCRRGSGFQGHRLTIVEVCTDGAAAFRRYRELHAAHPEREFYFAHTANTELEIDERPWVGVRWMDAARPAQ